ncbi:MAG: hypothetical protein KYX62_16450 [Pseudomonadota bacterium]|nr:hypothetical protein [Pseudomonadota bacterium]
MWKNTAEAPRYLAELKGVAATIPNEAILLNTVSLQEAKDSSGIENIVTSHCELYKTHQLTEAAVTLATKEVQDYIHALRQGLMVVRQQKIICLTEHGLVVKAKAGRSNYYINQPLYALLCEQT